MMRVDAGGVEKGEEVEEKLVEEGSVLEWEGEVIEGEREGCGGGEARGRERDGFGPRGD